MFQNLLLESRSYNNSAYHLSMKIFQLKQAFGLSVFDNWNLKWTWSEFSPYSFKPLTSTVLSKLSISVNKLPRSTEIYYIILRLFTSLLRLLAIETWIKSVVYASELQIFNPTISKQHFLENAYLWSTVEILCQ